MHLYSDSFWILVCAFALSIPNCFSNFFLVSWLLSWNLDSLSFYAFCSSSSNFSISLFCLLIITSNSLLASSSVNIFLILLTCYFWVGCSLRTPVFFYAISGRVVVFCFWGDSLVFFKVYFSFYGFSTLFNIYPPQMISPLTIAVHSSCSGFMKD